MRALQFTAYGVAGVLEWGDAPDPHAGPGQVRIAVRAASVNPIDWKTLAGALSGGQPLVGTGYLGYDAAGVVDEVGEGVTGVAAGDDVLDAASTLRRSTPCWTSTPRPVTRCSLMAAPVAWGAIAVQTAVARGARVIASSSEANHDYLREIGAIPVLYVDGVGGRVRTAAGGPVDAVFDVAGKTPVEELISLAPEASQVVSIANYTAGEAGARVTGAGADSSPMEALAQVAELLAQNKLVIKVQTFPFARAAEAYRISQDGHVRGKLVLVP